MIARIKAMIRHLARSMTTELAYSQEEEGIWRPEESLYYHKSRSLASRGVKSCREAEDEDYFISNADVHI